MSFLYGQNVKRKERMMKKKQRKKEWQKERNMAQSSHNALVGNTHVVNHAMHFATMRKHI